MAHDDEPLPTGAELLRHWLGRLTDGERVLLEAVAAHYPSVKSREAISEASQYKHSTRDAYLQGLSARRLISSTREGVVASKDLFD